jgi:UDP-N-acetylmuramate dehydrogenase
MDRARFAAEALELLGHGRIQADAPLAPHTTLGVGGLADWLVDVRTAHELAALLDLARRAEVPVTLLGGGSNVLVADAGIRGVVVRLRLSEIRETASGRVRADAGVTINGLVRWMVSRGLAGLEAWAGTPGTVGGAVFGNAHWSGVNIGQRIVQVLLASAGGDFSVVGADRMEFGYDTSRLQRTREILVWAEFAVSRGEPAQLREKARDSLAYRKRTQPLAMPSAGCIFQNPDPDRDTVPEGLPPSAGALIDRAGLKGHRIGRALISPTHANFIVNEGGATASDVRALIETARAAVRDRFGVLLRDEVVFLGM